MRSHPKRWDYRSAEKRGAVMNPERVHDLRIPCPVCFAETGQDCFDEEHRELGNGTVHFWRRVKRLAIEKGLAEKSS